MRRACDVATVPTAKVASWGRRMLRNYRPDHATNQDYTWRYVNMVRSNIRYGSQDVGNDSKMLHKYQNILMNGGICGRRAFFGRFILRSFGIPTAARPSKGHGALCHWTPDDGWVVNLGGGWGAGWTKTVYRNDLDFLSTTQARQVQQHKSGKASKAKQSNASKAKKSKRSKRSKGSKQSKQRKAKHDA